MRIRGNLLRILFGINLLFFIYSMFSPWAWTNRQLMFERPFVYRSGEELYWSFQVVFYGPLDGYENRLISWDFWFGPHERVLLWDFWFSREMYYYGFTYEWISIFVFQLLTIFSGIWVMARRWQKTTSMLAPSSFSLLSVFLGLLLLARFMFVWYGYANFVWGLLFAMFSTLFFWLLFFFRYTLERRKRKQALQD